MSRLYAKQKEKFIIRYRWIGYFVVTIALFSLYSLNLVALISFNLGNLYVLLADVSGNNASLLATAQQFYTVTEHTKVPLTRLPYMQGWAWFQQGEFEKAINSWKEFPDADYWLTIRGKVLLKQGQFESAKGILTMASELNPKSSTIYYYGGLAYYRLERYDEALDWYTRALELDSFDERFMDNPPKGDVWWPARPDNLTQYPTPVMTYIQMSAVYYQLGQWDMMRDAALSAIDIDPDEPLGYFQLGCAYYRWAGSLSDSKDATQFYRLAEESFITIVDQIPDYQYPFFLILARVYVGLGEVSAATSAYQHVLEVSDQANYQYEVARFYVTIGQVEASLSLYESVLAQTPHEAQFSQRWIDAAEAYWMIDEREIACTLFRQGIDICGDKECAAQNSILWNVCFGEK
jgi:tetratricopeptide (TPR) repeat protein